MYKIKTIQGKGRGLVAAKAIRKGQLIEASPMLVFSHKDSKVLDKTLLGSYVFAYSATKTCLALGVGSLFNHNNSPNVECYFHDGENTMYFNAITAIAAGDELTINYGWPKKYLDF